MFEDLEKLTVIMEMQAGDSGSTLLAQHMLLADPKHPMTMVLGMDVNEEGAVNFKLVCYGPPEREVVGTVLKMAANAVMNGAVAQEEFRHNDGTVCNAAAPCGGPEAHKS